MNLSRSESEDWPSDAEEICKELSEQARTRGRKYVKIYNSRGAMLCFIGVEK